MLATSGADPGLGKGGSIGVRTREILATPTLGSTTPIQDQLIPEQRVNRAFFDSVSFKGEPQ